MKLILLYIRTLSRFKVYTVINIIGLALSLACVIIIFEDKSGRSNQSGIK